MVLGVHGDPVDEAEVDDIDPEPGSTTSRIASSTSATLAGRVSVSDMALSIQRSIPVWASASARAIQGGRAHLTRAGVAGDASQGDGVADDVLVAAVGTLGGQHRPDGGVFLPRRCHRFPSDQVGEHRGRRHRDRAPERVIRDVAEAAIVQRDAQGHLVAAGGLT